MILPTKGLCSLLFYLAADGSMSPMIWQFFFVQNFSSIHVIRVSKVWRSAKLVTTCHRIHAPTTLFRLMSLSQSVPNSHHGGLPKNGLIQSKNTLRSTNHLYWLYAQCLCGHFSKSPLRPKIWSFGCGLKILFTFLLCDLAWVMVPTALFYNRLSPRFGRKPISTLWCNKLC